jgi:hypothetical protein
MSIASHLQQHWMQHLSIGSASIWVFILGLNWEGITATIIGGTGIFIATSLLKRVSPKWFGK